YIYLPACVIDFTKNVEDPNIFAVFDAEKERISLEKIDGAKRNCSLPLTDIVHRMLSHALAYL
ncbi:MAG TPA: hypothetical protein O0X50_03540, partial [Methanocorpusculum sp.]|nr:hypothetical protein [Methanocorpusculum sp.]